MEQVRERELKYDVEPGWTTRVPDSVVPAGGRVTVDEHRLVSTYHDTAGWTLLGARVTVRRRSGGGEDGWQIKVPAGVARTELHLPDGPDVPTQAAELLFGLRRGEPLVPVARIETRRTRHRIEDADGRLLAEVADDEVTAEQLGEQLTVRTWRELEVELAAGGEKLLGRIDKALRKAGATPAAAPSKLARALDHTAPERPRGLSTGALVLDNLQTQCRRIVAGDLAARSGADQVHRTRVATRRLRSVLRVFGDGFDPEETRRLDEELRWFAGVLGAARDAQVLRRHLDDQVAGLPAEAVLGPVRSRLHRELGDRSRAADAGLREAMAGERYLALLDALARWDAHPPLSDAGFGKPKGYLRASRRKAAKRLRRAVTLSRDPGVTDTEVDAALHRARKAAKRARYTAEVLRPALGRTAKRQRASARHVQDVLGAGQDAVLASAVLREIGARAGVTPEENGFTFGVLWEAQQHRRRQARVAARTLVIEH